MKFWQRRMIAVATNKYIKNFMQNRAHKFLMVDKFTGGYTTKEVTEKIISLNSQGYRLSLYYFGEYINDPTIINNTVSILKEIARILGKLKLDVHISVDPTQIGYLIDEDTMINNAIALATEVKNNSIENDSTSKNFLMLDMEDYTVNASTVDLCYRLLSESLPVAITLQAYLHRTESDLVRIIRDGGAVRLCKGAFAEKKDIAFSKRDVIDKYFLNSSELMLSNEAKETGFYPGFATHDDQIIEKVIEIADKNGWKKHEYEFEFLFGFNTKLQQHLLKHDYLVRLYLPFGTDWWPYAIRRIGERPQNLNLLLRSMRSK